MSIIKSCLRKNKKSQDEEADVAEKDKLKDSDVNKSLLNQSTN
jgi:hypothetical protein